MVKLILANLSRCNILNGQAQFPLGYSSPVTILHYSVKSNTKC